MLARATVSNHGLDDQIEARDAQLLANTPITNHLI